MLFELLVVTCVPSISILSDEFAFYFNKQNSNTYLQLKGRI